MSRDVCAFRLVKNHLVHDEDENEDDDDDDIITTVPSTRDAVRAKSYYWRINRRRLRRVSVANTRDTVRQRHESSQRRWDSVLYRYVCIIYVYVRASDDFFLFLDSRVAVGILYKYMYYIGVLTSSLNNNHLYILTDISFIFFTAVDMSFYIGNCSHNQ